MKLDGVSLFAGLEPAVLEDLAGKSTLRRFEPGDALCTEGDPCTTLLVISSGLATVAIGDGQVNLMRRGDVVGELGVLSGEPRTATVEAALPTEVLEIDRSLVAALFADHPELLGNLARLFRSRLLRANTRQLDRDRGETVVVVAAPSARQLVADALRFVKGAVPRPVLTVELGPKETSLSLGADLTRSDDEALAQLDDLLVGRAFVFVATVGFDDASGLAKLGLAADRVVLVGEPAELDAATAQLGPAAGRVERVEVLRSGLDLDGRPAMAGRPGAGPWLARHLTRTKLGLALGAGGAKGYAHVGVLAALEDAGYKIDSVAGTSIGAVVGACVAMGNGADATEEQLDRIFDDETVAAIFSLNFSGTSTGAGVMRQACERFAGGLTFADLNIPLTVMCADLDSRLPVPITGWSLAEALVAATSLAGLFPPYEEDGRRLVDGLALIPVPVDAARAAGADLVLSVNLMSRDTLPAWPGEQPPVRVAGRQRLLETLLEVMDLTQLDASVAHAARADVVVTPRFGPCTWRDFELAPRFEAAGAAAAGPAIEQLRRLASPVAGA